MNDFMIVSRPWQPQDLLDDLQLLIDEEPDNYLNFRRTTMCTARDYLKEHFAEPGWISVEDRLPEGDQGYFIVWSGSCNYAGEAIWDGYTFSWIANDNKACATHWMPLPDPPEVEV